MIKPQQGLRRNSGRARGMFWALEGRVLLSGSMAGLASAVGPWMTSRDPSQVVPVDLGPTPIPDPNGLTTNLASASGTPLGANLNGESDRVEDHPFTDLVKTTRGFYNLAGRLASNGKTAFANTDSNGWPTEDFGLSLAD